MDLESENSALESVEDNEKLFNSQEVKFENNGNCDVDEKDNENESKEDYVKSPSLVIGESSGSSHLLFPVGKKGYGLKKWRRIKRDVIKEGVSNVDNSKLLKRGLPNSGANLNRAMQFSGGVKHNSEGSVSSTNARVRSPGNVVDLFAAIGNSGVGNVLGTGTDSENSEDRSSKSSTAASIPKMRYELPVGKGFASDKNGTRNWSGNNLCHSGQRGQPGKVQIETSKKLRGHVVKIEKENSHSSMESDSRSSNFVFMQGIYSGTSNGRQSGRSRNYDGDGENSDEAQGSEQQPSEELPGGSSQKNGGEFEDNFREGLAADSSWWIKEEKSESTGPSSDQDPLFYSILTLQSAEEALEKEILKFKDIGKEESTSDDLVEDDSTEQSQLGAFNETSFDFSESEVNSLKQSMNMLESKLDDATSLLKVKEAKIIELQESISGRRSQKVITGCALELHQDNYRDIEIELESLFKQKIEAEVEYLVISRTVQNLRVAVVGQITTLEEYKKQQAWMLDKLGDAEVKAAKLKNHCKDIASADETVKLKMRICKYSSYFLIQQLLFLIILSLFMWQLSPNYSKVVPT